MHDDEIQHLRWRPSLPLVMRVVLVLWVIGILYHYHDTVGFFVLVKDMAVR